MFNPHKVVGYGGHLACGDISSLVGRLVSRRIDAVFPSPGVPAPNPMNEFVALYRQEAVSTEHVFQFVNNTMIDFGSFRNSHNIFS